MEKKKKATVGRIFPIFFLTFCVRTLVRFSSILDFLLKDKKCFELKN